jgi:hypothetical protein
MPKPLTGRRLLAAFYKHVCEYDDGTVYVQHGQPLLGDVISDIKEWCERQDKDWYDIGIELKWYPDPPEAQWAASLSYGSPSMTPLGDAYARTPQTALMRAAVETAILEKKLAKKRSER